MLKGKGICRFHPYDKMHFEIGVSKVLLENKEPKFSLMKKSALVIKLEEIVPLDKF